MAINGAEVEVVGPGIEESTVQKQSYVQNMYFHNGSWRVRKGFGQLGEWDPSLSRYTAVLRSNSQGEGYNKVLGSRAMKTNFGHVQIITIVQQLTWLNNGDENDSRKNIFSAHIYDVTSGDHWEELLINPSGSTNVPLPFQKGYYQGLDRIVANTDQDTKPVNFVEFNDILYFSSDEFGVWYYKPAAFKGNRCKAKEHWRQDKYADNTLIKPLIFAANQTYAAEYDYFEDLPEPVVSIGVLGTRLVFLGQHTIFFSDPNKPQSVIVDNIIEIPSQAPLTAVKEINGNLLIFSSEETFIFQPQAGLIVAGRLTTLSESIGADNARVVTKFDNKVVFADKGGVYINAGALEITKISLPVEDFFKSALSNPLNRYLVDTGTISTTATQPSMSSRYDADFASMVYWEKYKLLFLTVKDGPRSITLCYSIENGQWSEWAWESAAYNEGNVAKVGIRDNQRTDNLVSLGQQLWAVGIDFTNQMTDSAQRWNGAAWVPSPNQNQKFKSLVISEYGRGGSIDRSSTYEDYRYGIGEWLTPYVSTGTGYTGTDRGVGPDLYFGPPVKVKPGFVLDGQTWTRGGALVPVYYKWDQTFGTNQFVEDNVYHFEISFSYDEQNWTIQNTTAGGVKRINPVFVEGLENLRGGYGFDAAGFPMVANLNQFLTAANGVVNISWDAHVNFAGATAPYKHFWSQFDFVNNALPAYVSALPYQTDNQVLFWLPFIKNNDNSTSSINIEGVNSVFYSNKFQAGAVVAANLFYKTTNHVYRWSSLAANRNVNDVKAQGVDWCYLSPAIEPNEQKQSKVRGLYTKLSSTGTATNQIANAWGTAAYAPRVFNTSVSSDYRRWGTQIVDYTGDPAGVSESDLAKVQPSIRTRVKNTATDMDYKVFEDAQNLWDNNILTDDVQFGEMATSNSTKGQFFSWLMWGHMLNKAESIVIKGAKAVARIVGSRRRKGH